MFYLSYKFWFYLSGNIPLKFSQIYTLTNESLKKQITAAEKNQRLNSRTKNIGTCYSQTFYNPSPHTLVTKMKYGHLRTERLMLAIAMQ